MTSDECEKDKLGSWNRKLRGWEAEKLGNWKLKV
jgi:hypothetical protein